MGHIFVSYSHKDKKYVYKLQEAIQKEGFQVWMDDRIDYGGEWPKVIQKHLDECDVFIVVMSKNAYASKWVHNEVARADRKKKPIVPLLLQGDPWLSVEAVQYEDVSDELLPSEKFYENLARHTRRRKTRKAIIHEPALKEVKNSITAGKKARQRQEPSAGLQKTLTALSRRGSGRRRQKSKQARKWPTWV